MLDQVAQTPLPNGARMEYQATSDQTALPAVNTVNVPPVFLEIPASLRHIHLLSRCACALAETVPNLAEPTVNLYNLELAIQEVAVNIVNHAYAGQEGRIQMTLQLAEQTPQLTLCFHDTGASFDPSQVPAPRLGELQEHGFGLFLVRELMDEVTYLPSATGNLWKLVKILPVEE